MWKAYLDFEISQGQIVRAREIYTNLLERTKSVKIWLSFAKFEQTEAKSVVEARNIYTKAATYFKDECKYLSDQPEEDDTIE